MLGLKQWRGAKPFLGILTLIVAVIGGEWVTDFGLATQRIAYIFTMGEGPDQIVIPARVTGDDEGRQATTPKFLLQRGQRAFCQFVVHREYIDETVVRTPSWVSVFGS